MAAVAPNNYNRFAYWNRLASQAKTIQEVVSISDRSYDMLLDEEKSDVMYSDWCWSFLAIWESNNRVEVQPPDAVGDNYSNDDDEIPL